MEKGASHGISFKDKVGYALGDTGGILTFGLVTPFQLMFYTDVLGITAAKAGVLLLVARIWDAINDPMWGAFIDSRKPTRYGRFRPYILGASFPLAIAAVLMFTKLPGLTAGQYLVYAYITYIFYGMMYTGTNIPFGSLASVITDDEIERSSLSMFRSIGAGIGGLPAQMLLPLLVYSFNEKTGKNDILDPDKLFIGVLALAVVSLIVYYLHFRMTKERVALPPKQSSEKYNVIKSLKNFAKNTPFVVVCLVSMLLMAYQGYTQTNYNYLFKDYYGTPGLYTFVTVCTYLPMAIFIPFMGKLIRRFGKKELCAAGIGFAAVINILMFAIRSTPLVENPYIFLALVFLSGAGMTFLVLEIWALAMDVLDYHELLSGRREEGTGYSVFSFMRKLGTAAAGSGAAFLLDYIGYDVDKVGLGQDEAVLTRLYDMATVIPAVALVVMFVLLAFCYRFSKEKLAALHEELDASRAGS